VYEYRATVVRVLDGDTVELDIDYGRRIHQTEICRLYGINAPEVTGPTKVAGLAAASRLKELVTGKRLIIHTHLDRNDKYGRLLVELWLADDPSQCLNHLLLREGHAKPYMLLGENNASENDKLVFDDFGIIDSGL
jgi:micrococcal nuclease